MGALSSRNTVAVSIRMLATQQPNSHLVAVVELGHAQIRAPLDCDRSRQPELLPRGAPHSLALPRLPLLLLLRGMPVTLRTENAHWYAAARVAQYRLESNRQIKHFLPHLPVLQLYGVWLGSELTRRKR